MARCATIKASGERCKAQAVIGYDQCFMHAPGLAERRKKATSKGGKTGGNGRPKQRLELVHKVANTMISKLLDGAIDPSVAAVIIQAGHLKLRAVLADLKIEEHEEILTRVEELEQMLKRRKGGKGWDYGTG
jgi:hypothetical protein